MNQITNILINQKLNNIKRVAAMLCLGYGGFILDKDKDKIPLYSFHIQCPYRFILNNKIILASYDISKRFQKNFDDAAENTIFDEIVKKIFLPLLPLKIIHIKISNFGDIEIIFENKMIFQTFIDSSQEVEHWRLSDETKDFKEDLVFFKEEKKFAEKSKNYTWIEAHLPRNL